MNDLTILTNDLATLPTDDLRKQLAHGLTLTAITLTRLGAVWAELERRGEDLSDLKIGIARTLPLIASGRLAAEAVVAFAGRPMILRALEGVPLEQQRRLADGEPIPVYLQGESEPKALPLSRIPSAAVTRVISEGIVRTPAEQRLAIREKKRRKPDGDESRKYTVTVDREARTIKLGKMTIPIATIIAALAEAAGTRGPILDTPEAPARVVGGKFTDEERERLRAACKAHGLMEWELVRQAVMAWLL
jgi:hypothetical protein